jgi:tetratricopeptide (TPR) repeat protein
MAYPGNTKLSAQAQDRVMTAFKQVVEKLQQGNREEALIGLEFVLRLDPAYAPAKNLHQQLSSGAAEIDLNEVLSQLQSPTTETINTMLVEAVEMYDERDFAGARAKVEQVLLDLPGHEEARSLLSQLDNATKGSSQVGQFLQQARDALANGDSQEAANFVMMAQALDPHHSEIAQTISQIEQAGNVSLDQAGFTGEEQQPPAESSEPGIGGFEPLVGSSDLFSEPEHDAPIAGMGDAVGFEEPAPVDGPTLGPPPPHVSAATGPAAVAPERSTPTEAYYEEADVAEEGLFETGPAMSAGDSGEVTVDPSDTPAVIRDLLSKGGAAAAEDDFAAAIDAWSRILLIDHKHEEALDRIEQIRHTKEEVERRIEPMLADALSSHRSGDLEVAADFVRRALELCPKNVEASRLQEAIQRGASPDIGDVAGDASMPDLEDDLFTEEFEATADFGQAAPAPSQAAEGAWRTPEKPKRKLSWQLWAVIGGAGIVILGVAMWFGGFFAPAPEAEQRVNVVGRVLAEAAEMYDQKRVEEAILHLEQNSADDPFQTRIDRALDTYRAAIATPVPTPIPEGLTTCRELLEEGRWMAAYDRVMSELRSHPNDPGLEEIRQRILVVEPVAADLYGSVKAGNHQAALDLSKSLLLKRPDDSEVASAYDRLLFNAALAELRAFNLPSAESYLTELNQRQPEDAEVLRILEFIETYKIRPIDMQLEIFIGSLSER